MFPKRETIDRSKRENKPNNSLNNVPSPENKNELVDKLDINGLVCVFLPDSTTSVLQGSQDGIMLTKRLCQQTQPRIKKERMMEDSLQSLEQDMDRGTSDFGNNFKEIPQRDNLASTVSNVAISWQEIPANTLKNGWEILPRDESGFMGFELVDFSSDHGGGEMTSEDTGDRMGLDRASITGSCNPCSSSSLCGSAPCLHRAGTGESSSSESADDPLTMENRVKYLQSVDFLQLTLNEKTEIKARGRPTPFLSIQQNSTSRNKEYTRQFNTSFYQKCDWLCGCDETKALFCFPCLLFGGDTSWTKNGVTDLRHLPQKILKHEQSVKHMHNVIDFSLLGKVNFAAKKDKSRKLSVGEHNEQVRKNRVALSKIINCMKFCGKFELSFTGHESSNYRNMGVFHGLVDFARELDSSLDAHFTATFYEGITESFQIELLEAMSEICKSKIKEEVKSAEYLAIMCDGMTDIYDKTHLGIVLRYELRGKPVERFWGFFNPINTTTEALSSVLLKELQTLIGDCPFKLIAQTYDGAVASSGVNNGAQTRIKEVFTNAHFIHCYVHHMNMSLEKATSQNTDVQVFFNCLTGIITFFSESSQRMAVLKNVAGQRIPYPSSISCNFKNRTVNAVLEMKGILIECCSILEASNSRVTGSAASGIKRILNDPDFEFWLEFFSKVMPHVDSMFSGLQARNIEAGKVNTSLKVFNSAVERLREEYNAKVLLPEQKRRKLNTNRTAAVKEVCDIVLLQCRERFGFIKHLEARKLLLVNNFPLYAQNFPSNEFAQAVVAYPMLEKDKLRTELTVLYSRKNLFQSESLIDFLETLKDNHLQSTFPNTVKLIKILITTPMTTTEAERCFSTMKRMQTFLRNTMVKDRLSALAMLSIENKLITVMKDFNEKVINRVATSETLRTEFIFK